VRLDTLTAVTPLRDDRDGTGPTATVPEAGHGAVPDAGRGSAGGTGEDSAAVTPRQVPAQPPPARTASPKPATDHPTPTPGLAPAERGGGSDAAAGGGTDSAASATRQSRARARLAAVSGTGRYVAVLAVISASLAVLVKYELFPYLSVNNDEALYRLQAQALAGGHLFPAASDPAGSYAPWLAVPVDAHYVLKYTPFVPALFALSLLATGGYAAALALVAATAVVVTYRLGVALFDDRRVGAVAATLFAASPLVVLLSGMLLAYLPVLALVELAVLGLLAGLRSGRPWPLVGAGLAAGIAGAVRPFDVLVLLLPLAGWATAVGGGRRWWLARWLAAGFAGPGVALLAFDAAATGSALQLPFSYLESEDAMGFGVRRLYPSDRAHHFGLADGLASVGDHLWLLGGWTCGGVILLGCAIAAVARRRVSGPGLALGAGVLLLLVGYVGFWGAWNAAELWGGIRYVGPFYGLPVLAALVLLGARGLVDLAAVRPRLAGAAGVGAAGLTCFVLVGAIPANATLTGHDRDLAAIVDGLSGDPVVFLSVDPAYLMHPTSLAANQPDLGGPVLWAVSTGDDDLTVAARHTDRPAYLLRLPPAYNRTPDSPAGARLERLAVRTGAQVSLAVTIDAPAEPTRAARLVVTTGNQNVSYPLDPTRSITAQLDVDADGARLRGLPGAATVTTHGRPAAAATADRTVALALYTTPARTGREQFVDRQLLPAALATADATTTGTTTTGTTTTGSSTSGSSTSGASTSGALASGGVDGTARAAAGRVTVLASTGVVAATDGREPPPLHLTLDR
jgi:hypothetical protein